MNWTDLAFGVALLVGAACTWEYFRIHAAEPVHVRHPQPPRFGPNQAALVAWLDVNAPWLQRQLETMSLNEVRIRLNLITGCTVQASDSLETGCAVFLAALKARREAL